jgi:peptide/nickel transport system permease protein
VAVCGPWLVRDATEFLGGPSSATVVAVLAGHDASGQDVFAQTIVGARTSLIIGFLVGVVVTFVGASIGIAAGFFGGWVDDALSLVTTFF